MLDTDSKTQDVFKCNTCKAAFPSSDKVKEHYRGDWHVLNSKRRANGLLPLKRSEFKLLQQSSSSSSPNSRKNTEKETKRPPKAKEEIPKQLLPPAPPSSQEEAIHGKGAENEGQDGDGGDDEGEDIWEDVDEDGNTVADSATESIAQAKIGANISIFDDKEFSSTESCLQYMSEQYGFFIPDIEYLVDVDGLLVYLNEKVKLGGYCLYCQKLFRPGRSTQQHMISKSHCKILYDDEDEDEYENFYDFTAQNEVELDEDGNVIEKEMTVSTIGELVLPSGKTVGHREFRRYYKQYHRPADEREPVLAQQREELLRLCSKFGASSVKMDEVMSLSSADVMTNLMSYQKSVRKNRIVEQRAAQRLAQINQRREYRSNTQKLRSAENTTATIRDYHARLM